jgi:hypothetical protein
MARRLSHPVAISPIVIIVGDSIRRPVFLLGEVLNTLRRGTQRRIPCRSLLELFSRETKRAGSAGATKQPLFDNGTVSTRRPFNPTAHGVGLTTMLAALFDSAPLYSSAGARAVLPPCRSVPSATSHKKNNTEDPSSREADKHKLAQRPAGRQFGCL